LAGVAVEIVAIGARTPVGLRAETSAAAVRAGISRVREHPFLIDLQGEPRRLAYDARIETTRFGRERVVALGASALAETIDKLDADESFAKLDRVPVLVAVPETRPGFDEAAAQRTLTGLAEALSGRAQQLSFEVCGRGHAGSLRGIEQARALITARRCELCLVGGVDSYLEPDTLDDLESARRLKVEGVRSGFFPGEGAAFMAFSGPGIARRLGIPVLASCVGERTASEARVIDGEEEVLGHGLAAAILGAASGLRLPEEAVDFTYCDLNGERYRADEWAFAVLRAHAVLGDTAFEAPADCWGDVGAASGVLGCVLAVRAWVRGYAPGRRALVWAGSDRGLRGAAILEAPGG
jgi:3-oxoacyl-[acyl-carrier-protein] synthase-1